MIFNHTALWLRTTVLDNAQNQCAHFSSKCYNSHHEKLRRSFLQKSKVCHFELGCAHFAFRQFTLFIKNYKDHAGFIPTTKSLI